MASQTPAPEPVTAASKSPGNKAETLSFPAEDALRLEPHLPPWISPEQHQRYQGDLGRDVAILNNKKPYVTLTFATSLDSSLSLARGTRTVLSGPQSKAMTHYLRSRHAAICVGVGTAIADDPGLNCRLDASSTSKAHQPRPIIIDPHARWALAEDAKVLQLVRSGLGLAPFILVSSSSSLGDEAFVARRELLERHGGKYILVGSADEKNAGPASKRFGWDDILKAVSNEGLDSIMIEGGGQIINSLLTPPNNELIDSVIVTIAPTWLGQGGVVVSPPRSMGTDGKPFTPIRLTGTSWHPLGEDVVLCGRILR